MTKFACNVAIYGDGRNLVMVYKDPITGKKVAEVQRHNRPRQSS